VSVGPFEMLESVLVVSSCSEQGGSSLEIRLQLSVLSAPGTVRGWDKEVPDVPPKRWASRVLSARVLRTTRTSCRDPIFGSRPEASPHKRPYKTTHF
jgi:hypothetical protein